MKRVGKLVCVLLMVSLMISLIGCGSEKSESVQESAPEESETIKSTESSAQNGEKKRVVIFSKKREWEEGWNELKDQYMKEHEDVEIVVNLTDSGTYYDELKTYLATGDLPDIIQTVPGTVLSLWQQNLVPLNDMEVLDHMDKEIVDEYLVDGNYYGVPLFMELHGVIYNMDFLNQVGYEEAPATLDEFIDLNEKLIANGLPTGISPWKSGGSIVGHMTAPVFSSQENPVEYMTKIQNGEVDLTKEKSFLELFDYLDATIEYGNKDAVNTDSTTERNALYAEQYAWYGHDGSWLTPAIRSTNPDLEDHIQLGVYPFSNEESENKIGRSTQSLSVMQTSRNAEDAMDFLDWMLGTDEGCDILVKKCNAVLLRSDYQMSAEDIGVLSAQGVEYVENGQSYGNFRYIPDEASAKIAAAFEKYLGGAVDRETALKEIQEIFEETK